ncbi:ATP-dependent nuclease [Bacillus pseudomycoides]|uniref:ATP-dependent nuclease n=1 Tax=Bacillus pseudomycoides TaxID=64104 RepID=UPI000BEC2F39|nr:AAA family ATPase [Bacillus pseudomycoides]PEB38414.1 ATP-dependent endonuclease [Bacillus pseudomycoides]PGD83258.1 ATP-dependent endonuclease [Bacillus pseudomycoides]PGE01292.1 ATP-dependent endonuclease [Bacillus pseudomycoides]PHE72001.1 ATP-dependent endonuclease [Bacillus pseudomycoides]PHG20993.1 ATP-dependent endonuclease [Bacillus pseudomycoides]
MKLTKLTIRNFKGIKELSLDIENISIIIGPNNCSKSTVLEALCIFGGSSSKLDKNLYYRHDTSNPITFHATFSDLTEEEVNLHGIKASIHEPSGKFIVRSTYIYGEKVERASKLSGIEEHDLGEEGWNGKMGGGNNGSHFINAFPEVIYIPAVKNANDDIKDNSPYMKTLYALYKDVIKGLEEYKEAQEKTKLLQDKINSHENERIQYFEEEVQGFLKEVTSTKIKFNVDINPLDEIVSTSLKPNFDYNGLETLLTHQGNGVQRTFMLSILKGFKMYMKKFQGEEKGINRPLIIAIEEPELYLHPHLARVFKETLYSLADEGFFQVIATSHSPNFIDLAKPHRTLAKLSLNQEKNVTANQVDSNIYGLPLQEKEKFQALLRFNPYINEIFFAENVILVEGDTEVIALKLIGEKLVANGELERDVYDRTSVVNCAGKGTMYIVLNVLNNFGIKYTCIHDYDITELNKKGETRTVASLKKVLTLNHKIEKLCEIRNNKKFVFQYTFEEEMPPDYVKGSSKSFAAYEYLKDKELQEMPIGLLNIIKSSYGIVLEEEIDHKNSILLERYNWENLNQAKIEWAAPKDDEYVISIWMRKSIQELPISAE